jgi:hypothetical protein
MYALVSFCSRPAFSPKMPISLALSASNDAIVSQWPGKKQKQKKEFERDENERRRVGSSNPKMTNAE